MAALDWSQSPAVESIPEKVSGAWVFKDTRMPVSVVFENLEDGLSIDELIELYDGLTREHVEAALDFAARSLVASKTSHQMRILFDQGAPLPLKRFLFGHSVRTARQEGWVRLTRGNLLRAVEDSGFDLLVTADNNIDYEQTSLAAG